MKKEKRGVITISDSGSVSIPSETKMSIEEIADLFGLYYREAKWHIRAIEKSGIVSGDYSMCCTAEGQKVYSEYYGLEMIIALAFRIQSKNATLFRECLMERVSVNHLCQKNNLSYFSLN